MAEQKVAIVSDTTLDVPDEICEELGVHLAPVNVLAGEHSYKDRLEISIEEANKLMLEGTVRLSTSAVAPADWLEAFEKATEISKEIVAFSISPKLSSTYASALSAAELLEDGHVHVVDTKTILSSMGLVVQECARRAKAGADLDEILSVAGRLIEKVRMVVTSNSRAFAKDGGRYRGEGVPESEEGLPIFRIWEIGWKEIDRGPTRQACLDKLLDWMAKDLEEVGYAPGMPLKVALDHVVSLDEATYLRNRIQERYRPKELFVWKIGPTAAVHLGPGTVGMGYLADDDLT